MASLARLRIDVSGRIFDERDEMRNDEGSEPDARQQRKNSRTARNEEFDSRRASVADNSALSFELKNSKKNARSF